MGTIVIITTLYPSDLLEEWTTQRLSGARTPYRLNYTPTISEHLRLLNTPRYSFYTEQLEQIQETENGMETLELDTPNDTVSIPESMPSLESITPYLRN